VVVKDRQRFAKVNISLYHLVVQVVCLHEDTVEFDSLGMHGVNNL
jgi:hypothetical protein